jgi:hypothetical protein
MWAGLNILFLVGLCAVLYAVFFWLLAGVLFLFRVRNKGLYMVASVPVFLAMLATYVGWQSRPAVVFQRSFGFSPSPDVSGLQSSWLALGDSGTVFLRFRCNPATVDRIASRGLRRTGMAGPGPAGTGDAPPDWWRPPPDGVAYAGRFTGRDFASEEEYLVHDPRTGDVYFRFIGID